MPATGPLSSCAALVVLLDANSAPPTSTSIKVWTFRGLFSLSHLLCHFSLPSSTTAYCCSCSSSTSVFCSPCSSTSSTYCCPSSSSTSIFCCSLWTVFLSSLDFRERKDKTAVKFPVCRSVTNLSIKLVLMLGRLSTVMVVSLCELQSTQQQQQQQQLMVETCRVVRLHHGFTHRSLLLQLLNINSPGDIVARMVYFHKTMHTELHSY